MMMKRVVSSTNPLCRVSTCILVISASLFAAVSSFSSIPSFTAVHHHHRTKTTSTTSTDKSNVHQLRIERLSLCPTVASTRVSQHTASRSRSRLWSSTSGSSSSSSSSATAASPPPSTKPMKRATLGLITFDLDDTLYPIAPVIEEANNAFSRAMAKFGYEGINSNDIDVTAKEIRQQREQQDGTTAKNVEDSSSLQLTHTQVRELAIRKTLERAMLDRKLQETADEWATQVSYLADVVVQYARKWASTAVSDSVVNSIVNAWEMERHHAAERHLYPEVLDVLKEVKEQYPQLVIGAVTDGKANPMFMTFTLAPFFDFCMSWEDDQLGRSKFFQELSNVEGNAELSWIYNAALEKYKGMKTAAAAIASAKKEAIAAAAASSGGTGDEAVPGDNNSSNSTVEGSVEEQGETNDEAEIEEVPVWIHVGDDLAYDVGGSAQCGAKTILVELADKYGQTARQRFDNLRLGSDGTTTTTTMEQQQQQQPAWSTSTKNELIRRNIMNEAAEKYVDERIRFLNQLPNAIESILDKVTEEAINEEAPHP